MVFYQRWDLTKQAVCVIIVFLVMRLSMGAVLTELLQQQGQIMKGVTFLRDQIANLLNMGAVPMGLQQQKGQKIRDVQVVKKQNLVVVLMESRVPWVIIALAVSQFVLQVNLDAAQTKLLWPMVRIMKDVVWPINSGVVLTI